MQRNATQPPFFPPKTPEGSKQTWRRCACLLLPGFVTERDGGNRISTDSEVTARRETVSGPREGGSDPEMDDQAPPSPQPGVLVAPGQPVLATDLLGHSGWFATHQFPVSARGVTTVVVPMKDRHTKPTSSSSSSIMNTTCFELSFLQTGHHPSPRSLLHIWISHLHRPWSPRSRSQSSDETALPPTQCQTRSWPLRKQQAR